MSVSTSSDTAIFNTSGDYDVSIPSDAAQYVGNITFGSSATGTVTVNLQKRLNVGIVGTGGTISVLSGNHEFVGKNSDAGDIWFNGSIYDSVGPLIIWNTDSGTSLTFTDTHMRVNHNNTKIAKTGAGLVVLAGNNVGTTNAWRFARFDVEEGTLKIAHDMATGYIGNNYRVFDGATMELAADYNSIGGSLSLYGAGVDGSGAIYNSSGDNSINEGSGTILLVTDSTISVNDGSTLTIQQDISGNGRLVKDGAGLLRLSQSTTASTYSGGTTVNAGILQVSHNNALGVGSVQVNSSAELKIDSSVTVDNDIALDDGSVTRSVLLGQAWDLGTSGSIYSDMESGVATSAQILSSQNASAAGNLSYAFSTSSIATNDELRVSDVFSASGTGSDIYVLQLKVANIEGLYELGWLNGEDLWVNAIDGNSQLGGSAISNIAGNFESSGASATSDYLGTWGYDSSSGTVWAILDHDGQFSVITSVPEPAEYAAMFSMALFALILFHRRGAFI